MQHELTLTFFRSAGRILLGEDTGDDQANPKKCIVFGKPQKNSKAILLPTLELSGYIFFGFFFELR